MQRQSSTKDIRAIPLKLKYSSRYFNCPCSKPCIPRYMQMMMEKWISKSSYLAVSEFHLEIYNDLGQLLEKLFVLAFDRGQNSKDLDSRTCRKFAITVYRETPQKTFTIFCRARSDSEVEECRRALGLLETRWSQYITAIIDMYSEMQ